jgi:radical SAM superfamily enzyme YgiQ (UPF0313 family)
MKNPKILALFLIICIFVAPVQKTDAYQILSSDSHSCLSPSISLSHNNIKTAFEKNSYSIIDRIASFNNIAIPIASVNSLKAQLKKNSSDKSNNTRIDIVGFSAPEQPQLSTTTALYSLSGNLKNYFGKSIDVNIYDMYADHELSVEKIVQKIIQDKPRILGLSITIGTLPYAVELVEQLKNKIAVSEMPFIVLGGIIPSYKPEKLLKEYLPDAMIVQGEGEIPYIQLVEWVRGNIDLKNVNNLIYVDDNNQIITTKKIVHDLNQIALTDIDHILDYAKKGVHVYIEASRGCPWGGCLFCARRQFWGSSKSSKWRPRPIKHIMSEIEKLIQNDIYSFNFADEEFLGTGEAAVQRALDLAEAIIELNKKYGKKIKFTFSARADAVWNRRDDNNPELRIKRIEVLRKFKQAGLQKVFLGIESGNASQLKRYNKGLTIRESENAIKIVRMLGLGLEAGFIMVDPEVTIGEIESNVDFIQRNFLLKDISWFINALKIMEGTPFSKLYKHYPRIKLSKDSDVNSLQYSYAFKNQDVEKLVSTANEAFYDSMKLYYILKSIFRTGQKKLTNQEFELYLLYRERIIDIYWESFKQMLYAINSRNSESGIQAMLMRAKSESIALQIELARGIVVDLMQVEKKSKMTLEVIELAQEFERKAKINVGKILLNMYNGRIPVGIERIREPSQSMTFNLRQNLSQQLFIGRSI